MLWAPGPREKPALPFWSSNTTAIAQTPASNTCLPLGKAYQGHSSPDRQSSSGWVRSSPSQGWAAPTAPQGRAAFGLN